MSAAQPIMKNDECRGGGGGGGTDAVTFGHLYLARSKVEIVGMDDAGPLRRLFAHRSKFNRPTGRRYCAEDCALTLTCHLCSVNLKPWHP